MFLSIRVLALACLVVLSLIHQADAACGGAGQFQHDFNAMGTNLPQGQDGELYCAVRCILHGDYCVTNYNGDEVYPAAAKGTSERDMSNLKAYYGPSISDWCVGQVEDFSYVFYNEVSNV
jgi:hypothetical protein